MDKKDGTSESIFLKRENLTKKHFSKTNLIEYGIILILCIILCSPLLQMHIASDTYNFMDLGYFEYPSQFFLKDARIVSTMVTYLAGFLHLPYEFFIIFMEILAVFIASLSIYCVYKTVKEKIGVEDSFKKILIGMASFILIFNCMALEYLLYAECSIMCLSVLFSVLAARIFTGNSKHRYVKSSLFVVLATFCYQGAVNIFLPLAILYILISSKEIKIKEVLKQILLSGSIIVIAYLINVISIYVLNVILNTTQGRVSGSIINNFVNFKNIMSNIIGVTILLNYNLWPRAIIFIMIAVTTIMIAFQERPTENLLKYITIIVLALSICIGPVFFMKSPSMEPRMAMSIGGIIGLSFIYLLSLEFKNNIAKNIASVLIIGFFVFNCINMVQIYTVHIATNKMDETMGKAIKYKIDKYERETGNIVTKVGYCRDVRHQSFHNTWDRKYSSFGQRAFDNYYCIIEALNYYCDKKFERVQMDQKVYEENFMEKNWDIYSDEQIVFKGDTMYLCTY